MKGPSSTKGACCLALALASALGAWACGSSLPTGVEAELPEVLAPDAGEPEVVDPDVINPDVTEPDPEDPDLGSPDASAQEPDAGSGAPDAGPGTPDAGSGTPDAGSGPRPDAGAVCSNTPPKETLPAGAAINSDPKFIYVYSNNLENLKTATEQCRGDWTDLFHYIKSQNPSPDLFLVQQISNAAQLKELVTYMTNNLPGIYAGIIAEADPNTMKSPCGPEKGQQTNAIIYRTGRFSPVGGKHVWQSWAMFSDGDCRRNNLARTKGVMQKLHDKVANKDVTVACIHWDTDQETGTPDPACAEKNIAETDAKLHATTFAADLLVFAGDTNEPDRNGDGSFKPWYRAANGDLGTRFDWRDALYWRCKQSAQAMQACLNDNWTIGSERRIDFLFALKGNGCKPPMSRQHTISFDEADAAAKQATGSDNALNYSDHRAVRAAIYY